MSLYSFKTCIEACQTLEESCPNKECKYWIEYEKDLNCTHIAIENNGNMTLRDIADRIGCSFVRIKQIEEQALLKFKEKSLNGDYL